MRKLIVATAALVGLAALGGGTAEARQIGPSAYHACASADLTVIGPDGREQAVGYRKSARVRLEGGRIRWSCAGAPGEAYCPTTAESAEIVRGAARRFEVRCLAP
ncbi:MAG: hypothetical protein AAFW46_14820 [Pseudomonadota bacterium]